MFTHDKLKKRIDEDKASGREPFKGGKYRGDRRLVDKLFLALEEETHKVPINRNGLTELMNDIGMSIWGFAVCGQYKLAYHYLGRLREYSNVELIYMHENRQN